MQDAMSDLPDIKNGASGREIGYGGEARSHFQKLVRPNVQYMLELFGSVVSLPISHTSTRRYEVSSSSQSCMTTSVRR